MANISKITVNSTDYDVKDALSRKHLAWYGTCTSDGASTTKAVTCANYSLDTGSTIDVKFSNTNSGAVASLKLNVNSTGEKSIKYKGADLPSADLIGAGNVLRFVYDGTNYEIVGGIGSGGSAPVTSVNTKTGDVVLDSTDVGAVASSQGVSHAGDFLIVNSQGIVEAVTMTAWQGGSF